MDDANQRLDHSPERQAPLSLRWETRQHWISLRQTYGVTETAAAMIMAIYAEAQIAGRMVSYSRRQEHYEIPGRYRSPLYSFRKVTAAADHLDSLGLIHHEKSRPGQRGWQSAMCATPALVDLMDRQLASGLQLVPVRPAEVIILRDRNGLPIDYADSAFPSRMRRALHDINEAVRDTDISGCAAAPMVRIFNRSPDRCGRIYPMGGAWQSMKKAARRQLSIGGECVVEIDYRTIHPAILYARAGVPLPADSYDISPWPRALVKVAFLILINAANWPQARQAIAHKEAMAEVAPVGSQEALRAADRLIADIRRVHAPIANAFHSDAGAGLMLIDSSIAETVMGRMLRKGVVVLPIHDSFLVAASKADLLREVMLQAAFEAGYPAIQVAVA